MTKTAKSISKALARRDRVAPETAWREVAWMGLGISTPPDWEVIRHSTDREQGRLIFIDRRRQRMILSWLRTAKPVDLNQSMKDYRGRDREEDPKAKFEEVSGNWFRGFARIADDPDVDTITRLARQSRDSNIWVEITLNWPWGRDTQVEQRLMDSFEFLQDTPDADLEKKEQAEYTEPTRWRMFGLDVTAPPGWTILHADSKPANIVLKFEHAANRRWDVHVRRVGMIDTWFKGDLKAFIRDSIGMQEDCEYEQTTYGDHEAMLGVSAEPMVNAKKLAGQGRRRRDLVWHDEQAHGVFSITTWSPKKDPIEPTDFTVEGYCTR